MLLSKLDLPDKTEVSIKWQTLQDSYSDYYQGTWRDFKTQYSSMLPKLGADSITIHSNTAVIKCRLKIY